MSISTECTGATRTAIQVNVTQPATASFAAATASSCGTSPFQLTGTVGGSATGGTYSSSGTGIFAPSATTLNATYTPSAADVAAGSVTLTLTSSGSTPCPDATATQTLNLSPAPVATFSYPAGTIYCAGSTSTVTPTLGTGATAGTFSSTTGLTLNATTGAITPSTSMLGTYTVTNTVAAANGCSAATATTTVTITAAPVATFSYPITIYCAGGNTTNATPTLGVGATAGIFSSTAGLVINATTGVINVNASTAGTYTVTNTVAASGGCAVATATTSFIISPRPATPTLSAVYNGATTTLTSSVVTGAFPGSYQFYLNGVAIPGATGQTYVVNGTPAQLGSYTVVTTNSNGCASLPSAPLVVTAARNGIAGTSLTVYPNPTPNGRATLELSGYRLTTQLTVLDALGRLIITELLPAAAGTTTRTLDLTGGATGVYLLRLRNADGIETRRLLRE